MVLPGTGTNPILEMQQAWKRRRTYLSKVTTMPNRAVKGEHLVPPSHSSLIRLSLDRLWPAGPAPCHLWKQLPPSCHH